jgi:hypothetical protein
MICFIFTKLPWFDLHAIEHSTIADEFYLVAQLAILVSRDVLASRRVSSLVPPGLKRRIILSATWLSAISSVRD